MEITMRRSNRQANAGADMSGIPALPFALGFVALICVTIAGFVSTCKGDQRNPADYGYAEALDHAQSHISPDGNIAAATCPAASTSGVARSTARETMISQIGFGSGGLLTTGR
jgi:hypothetical protein